MSQRLELDVVAEGVEPPDQAAFLTARGCSRMQGYYFARPVPGANRP
jgi:EAL domain-containing protein (putative c-di-GMP-specific phosphodiesterase class I)